MIQTIKIFVNWSFVTHNKLLEQIYRLDNNFIHLHICKCVNEIFTDVLKSWYFKTFGWCHLGAIVVYEGYYYMQSCISYEPSLNIFCIAY